MSSIELKAFSWALGFRAFSSMGKYEEVLSQPIRFRLGDNMSSGKYIESELNFFFKN